MAPISAFRQHPMQNVSPRRAVAHGRRELEVDELPDPILPRGDIAAAHRGADRLGRAADLHDPAQAIERGEPRRRLGLEVCERVVLEDENVVLLSQPQHPMDGRRGGRHSRRVLQASAGQIETRTMLGEYALELCDVGTVGGHAHGDAPGAIGAQERVEIEVAGIVDDHRVVRTEEKPADEIERLRAGDPSRQSGRNPPSRRVRRGARRIAAAMGSSRAARHIGAGARDPRARPGARPAGRQGRAPRNRAASPRPDRGNRASRPWRAD